MSRRVCHYCGTSERELRPYGPGGTWTCLPCVDADPERTQIAKRAYWAQLEAAEGASPLGVAAIGLSEGPIPYVPGRTEEAK